MKIIESPTQRRGIHAEDVVIHTDHVLLEGELEVPPHAQGLVIFAHGSGSSRHSPRNQYVARMFQESGVGTLLFDLLTRREELEDEPSRRMAFNIELLAERLMAAVEWLERNPKTSELRQGLFGSSTGGGAAMLAAARLGDRVGAVVSRGGRPDLAGDDALADVTAPTLFIVGSLDHIVLNLNRDALDQMRCEKELRVIPGATHLFEEPGKLEEVAHISAEWFRARLQIPMTVA